MKKVRFLMMAIAWAFVMCIPTQGVAQNKKLIKEAKKGSGEARAMLSTYYFKGIEGFERDIEQAKFWAREAEKSARDGSLEAQVWLTSCLFHGNQLYSKNLDLALKWAFAAWGNSSLQEENKPVIRELIEKIGNEIEKEKKAKYAAELAKLSASELSDKIKNAIRDRKATFEGEEELTNALLAKDKSDERTKALSEVYNFLILVANMYFDQTEAMMGRPGYKGTERGVKQLALAEQIKKRVNEEGDMTFGFLPGQREDDIVIRSSNERILGDGTKIRRKNGTLYVNNGGVMTLKMDDGSVFNGYFKEQVTFHGDYSEFENIPDSKLLLAEQFTPFQGNMKYADGTTDRFISGESVNKHNKAVKAEVNAEMKSIKAELARLGQKYGVAAIKNLKTTGSLKVGYSINMLKDYVKVWNKYISVQVKAGVGFYSQYGWYFYEPTLTEVLKYGKTANRVKLGATGTSTSLVYADCMVANGKIATIYQNTTVLAIKDL